MFDKSGTGHIDIKDFLSIMASLNRKEEEVNEILDEYGYWEGENKRDTLSFDEFIELMQTLEWRILVNEWELRQAEMDDNESVESATEEER